MKSYTVAAIFQIGMTTFDNTFIFMLLGEAQTFFNQDAARRKSSRSMSPILTTSTRCGGKSRRRRGLLDDRQRLASARPAASSMCLRSVSNVMFAILMLIMLVAALNIISGLIMLVQDKARAIVNLRTMGATRGAIMRIFLITGATIGFTGTGVGLALRPCSLLTTSSRSARV